jgi:hypothetical protein
MNEFATYYTARSMYREGLKTRICRKIQTIFSGYGEYESDVEVELLMSSLFYADRVFKGLDAKRTVELGWYLPRNTPATHQFLPKIRA